MKSAGCSVRVKWAAAQHPSNAPRNHVVTDGPVRAARTGPGADEVRASRRAVWPNPVHGVFVGYAAAHHPPNPAHLRVPSTNTCPRCGESYDEGLAFCPNDGAQLARAREPESLVGTLVADRYRIVSRIGEGGMGQVYLAEHIRMKRKSAIKIMRPSLLDDRDAVQRFSREAENASQLSHPNIAAIFDFGTTADGVIYLAMEFVDGESLAAKLERETALHPDIAVDILGQAADALQAAHDAHMLHRDVKPDNIMLGLRPDGTHLVKLVDFGIARTIDGADQKVTRTGLAIGTPQYMSPEQLSGETLDPRSDQYALALVAFTALTGKEAFKAESSKESLILRLTSRPRTLRDARDDIDWPETLQDVFDRALSPEPSARFDSVSAFADALSAAVASMTSTQTAELYRRALDVRVANVTARSLRSGAHDAVSASASAAGLAPVKPSAATPLGVTPLAGTVVFESTPTLAASERSPVVAKAGGVRWPLIGVGALVVAAVTLYALGRGKSSPTPAASSTGDTAARTVVDGALAVPGGTTPGTALGTAATPSTVPAAAPATVPPAAGAATSSATTSASSTPGTAGTTAGSAPGRVNSRSAALKAAADSAKEEQRDAERRATAARAKHEADSVARANSVRLRYPEAAARAMISRGVDAKARMVKNGDFRVVIMSTPIFVWRSEQALAWKDANAAAPGGPFDLVDPIEAWSSWKSLVASRRAVYVIEVTSEKMPWPSYAPTKIFDLKKGDVESVELTRDGVAVTLGSAAHVPAVVNTQAHTDGGKSVANAFVATIDPAVFLPHEDGSRPKVELLVRDAMRGGAVTRITLAESLVRRLYDDFGPWRDAIARP